jgi:hypothetical protein
MTRHQQKKGRKALQRENLAMVLKNELTVRLSCFLSQRKEKNDHLFFLTKKKKLEEEKKD